MSRARKLAHAFCAFNIWQLVAATIAREQKIRAMDICFMTRTIRKSFIPVLASMMLLSSVGADAAARLSAKCLQAEGKPGELLVDEITAAYLYDVIVRRLLPNLDRGPWMTESEDGGSYWHVVSWRPRTLTEHGEEAMYRAPVDLRVSKCDGAISHIRITR